MFFRLLILIVVSNAAFATDHKLSSQAGIFEREDTVHLPDILFKPRPFLPSSGDYWTDSIDNNVYIPSYKGLYKVACKVVNKGISRLYREALSNTLLQNDVYLPSKIEELSLRPSSYYPWWERSAFDSFVLDKGGSQVITYIVGENIRMLSLGPVDLYNDGKLNLKGWDILLSHDSSEALKHTEPYVDLENTERLVNFDIERPYSSRLLQWDVSGIVNLNIKLGSLGDNRSSFKLGVKISCPYISFRGSVRYQPFTNSASLRVSVALLCF